MKENRPSEHWGTLQNKSLANLKGNTLYIVGFTPQLLLQLWTSNKSTPSVTSTNKQRCQLDWKSLQYAFAQTIIRNVIAKGMQ